MRVRGVPRPRSGDGGRGRPPGPARPVVCLGGGSRQLVAHSRGPLPARPGEPERRDHGYVRNGVADMLVAFALLLCERHARAAPTRTGGTWPRPCDGSRATRARGQGAWSRSGTTRARTPWDPPARRSRPRRPSAWRGASGRITPRGTAPGWAWRRPGPAAPCVMAFRRALPTSTRRGGRRGPGRAIATSARTAGWKFTVGDARDRLAKLYPKIEIAD